MFSCYAVSFILIIEEKWLYFQHLETVIKSRIPGIQSLISKTVLELENELSRLGKPIAADAGVSVHILSCLGYRASSCFFLFIFNGDPPLLMFDAYDMQGKLYTIMEICRLFDQIYKEHLDGVYASYLDLLH